MFTADKIQSGYKAWLVFSLQFYESNEINYLLLVVLSQGI